jgi:anti-sigma-K factor RskA
MATEACRDWRGDIGLEALGRLEEPRRTALLAHVDGCADCRVARAELSTVARALDLADPSGVEQGELVQPSGELGDRILGRLQMERAVRRRRRRRGLVATISVVAAAVVVAFALAFTIGSRGGDHGTVVALRSSLPGVHAQAVLLKADGGTRVKLHVDGLDDGDWYWLWVTGANGRRVGAGTFSATRKDQDLTMTAALATSRTVRVWVTDAEDGVVLDGRVKAT